METSASKPRRVKTVNKKQGFPSLTAGKNWGKYLTGMTIEVVYTLVLCLLAFIVAVLLLAVM